MRIVSGPDALENVQSSDFKKWNRSPSSSLRSENPYDASRRVFDAFASINFDYTGELFSKDASVFAMGSCFAREIESALIQKGMNVISVDDSISSDAFKDGEGNIRSGFFHRFTPFSIWQEFMQCFDESADWKPDSLIFERNQKDWMDLNYWKIPGADSSLDAILERRGVAKELVKNAAKADLIILTLGFVEGWYHVPSNLHANYSNLGILMRHKEEFELHLLDCANTIRLLDEVYALLHKKHETGKFLLLVTVSPVPLQFTFTADDVIVANQTSKATLRIAAYEFASKYEDVLYFPSYEMVTHSKRSLAWRPDRIHVNSKMVRHVVNTFCESFLES